MADGRWIEIWAPSETDALGERNLARQVIEKVRDAEGQRVRDICWCETEGHGWVPKNTVPAHRRVFPACVVVEAVLILPPVDTHE